VVWDIEKSLETMKHQADEEGVRSIAMPRIDAGYGGLSLNKIRVSVVQIHSCPFKP